MICLFALLQGCILPQPDWKGGADLNLPKAWNNTEPGNPEKVTHGWIKEFEDPQMEQLVAEAIEHNRNLMAAAARLKAVREGTIISGAARLPSISASGGGSRSRSQSSGISGTLQPSVQIEGSRVALSASWEADFWGRIANLQKASIEDFKSNLADYKAARLSLAANTAKAWCNLIAARQQMDLASKTLDSFKRNYRITERNYKAGDPTSSSLSVNFGRNQVASAERSLISRQLISEDAKRSLELILGRYPTASVESREKLPTLGKAVPTGLPSGLLMRRPDLLAAAANVRASLQRSSAAKMDLLPSINLTAGKTNSSASLELQDLMQDPVSITRSLAMSVTQPIFRGGRLRARARQAAAQNEAAIATFSGTALQAFREVESALAREQSLATQEKYLDTELRQANLGESQAYRDYAQGILGILSVLEAQRRAFNARSSMISLRNERLQTRISLHLALGGDFESDRN
jgi:multidrug efflux system outer membrane protein